MSQTPHPWESTDVIVRFNKKWVPEPNTGCWLWTGATNNKGYGNFHIPNKERRTFLAHRFSWEIFYGKPCDEMYLLHRCDTPACVNPVHLFLGTQLDNMRDMKNKNRQKGSSQTHCKYGHLFNSINTHTDSRGHRHCRVCHRRYYKKVGVKRNLNKEKTHCPRGHPYSAENTTRMKNGGRQCKACRRKST